MNGEAEKLIREHIEAIGNLSQVAKATGLSRQTLYNYMKHGGQKHRFAHVVLKEYLNKKGDS